MKKNIFTASLALVAILFISSNAFGQQYVINTESSNIVWTGKKVTGEHTGTVGIKNGNIAKGKKGMTGDFTVDMQTLKCTDMQGEYGDKLVGHLASADFFNVEAHTTANFRMMRIAEQPDRKLGTTHVIYGKLTIKDISQDINFPASILIERGNLVASGKVTIDRTAFDIKYGSGKFFDSLGDKMIYDDFELEVNLVGKEATTREYKKVKKSKNTTKFKN